MNAAPLLHAERLTNGPLGPVDLEVHAGECVVIQGESGAGKTLLLRALADLDPADGNVVLSGVPRGDLTGPEWRRRVGYLAAEPGWWSDDAAAQMSDVAAALELMERVGVDAAALGRPVSRLSTGERQRLALIRALLLGPEVLLLDEPTAALDPASTLAVEALIAECLESGVGVIWVSHDTDQASRMATRVLSIAGGRLSTASNLAGGRP